MRKCTISGKILFILNSLAAGHLKKKLSWPHCSPDLSPSQNIKIWRKQCKTVEHPLSDTNWTSFLSHKSISWSLQIPDIYRLVLKEKQLHRSRTFFRHVAVMKLKMSRCFSKILNILCFSSSVMSKIWVYEISKSLHSLFYISCSVQTFSELVLYFVGFLLFAPWMKWPDRCDLRENANILRRIDSHFVLFQASGDTVVGYLIPLPIPTFSSSVNLK